MHTRDLSEEAHLKRQFSFDENSEGHTCYTVANGVPHHNVNCVDLSVPSLFPIDPKPSATFRVPVKQTSSLCVPFSDADDQTVSMTISGVPEQGVLSYHGQVIYEEMLPFELTFGW